MLIGYARVSTDGQNLKLQEDELRRAGCERIFSDVVSGSKTERTGLRDALNFCRKGDVLVVWKMDRLGRLLKHLIETIVMVRGLPFHQYLRQATTRIASQTESAVRTHRPLHEGLWSPAALFDLLQGIYISLYRAVRMHAKEKTKLFRLSNLVGDLVRGNMYISVQISPARNCPTTAVYPYLAPLVHLR